jgi:DNA-binding MarR family transcriptional regulator
MSNSDRFNEALQEWLRVFMTRSMHEMVLFLKATDLTMGQYSVLMRLHHDDGECGVGDVGSHLGITTAAASQLVEKLVQQDLLGRSEAAHDRRVRHLRLTNAGRDLVRRSLEARLGWTRALFEALPAEQRDAVSEALQHLARAAQGLDEASLALRRTVASEPQAAGEADGR